MKILTPILILVAFVAGFILSLKFFTSKPTVVQQPELINFTVDEKWFLTLNKFDRDCVLAKIQSFHDSEVSQ